MAKKGSIIIPTYKRLKLALSLANQIRKYYPDIEIIIIDQENKKPPSQQEINTLKINYFNLKKANTSLAKNKGIKESRGEIIIFFDDDVEITKKTIKEHLNCYQDKKIIGVAGRVINDGEKVPAKTNVETGKTNFLGTKFVYQFWSVKKQVVDFVYGCNMSFRKSVLEKINGFDKNFPKIFEEVDLSKRAKRYGKILFTPKALVYHHKASSGGIRPEEKLNKQNLIFENYGHYIAKNILFPFSLITLAKRTISAIAKSPQTTIILNKNYFKTLFKKIENTIKSNVFLILIFVIIIFVRLWRITALFNFTFTEEIQAFMAWEQIKNLHPIWIGASAANIKYYLGPGLVYLEALLLYLSKGDPMILGWFSAILGIITTLSIYYVTKDVFSKKAALFSTVFYGVSTLLNFSDRRFWNPTAIPFISVWLIYSLIKTKNNTRWYILTAILFGLSFHVHLTLLLFIIPAIYSLFSNFNKIKISTWIIGISCYLLITSPLIVFDIVHNFDNLLMPVRVLLGKQKTELNTFSISNTINHIHTLISTLGRVWFIKLFTDPQNEIVLESHMNMTQGNIFLSFLSLLSLFWFFIKKKQNKILIISLMILPLSFILYPSYNPEYYLVSFLTLLSIIIGYSLSSLPKYIGITIISLFIIANFFSTITMSDKYGLLIRKKLVVKTMKAINLKSFKLETEGTLPHKEFSYAGWRYLFKAYGKTPLQSNVDQIMGWLYPDEISDKKPELKIVVADTVKPKFKQKPIYKFNSGIYNSYVFKNQ